MQKRLKLGGMNCEHCAATVKDALEKLQGIETATISLEDQSALVEVSAEVAPDDYATAVTEAGYQFVAVE